MKLVLYETQAGTSVRRMAVRVTDPLKRSWERGIYMGPDSTAPEARRASTSS